MISSEKSELASTYFYSSKTLGMTLTEKIHRFRHKVVVLANVQGFSDRIVIAPAQEG